MKVILILIILSVSGCTSSKDNIDSDIIAVIHEQLRAAQNEDLAAYMNTIHPHSPFYKQTEIEMKSMFETYDLKHEMQDIHIIERRKTGAKVRWIQRTSKVSGPEFRNIKATVTHIFQKFNGKWKMFSGEMTDIAYED